LQEEVPISVLNVRKYTTDYMKQRPIITFLSDFGTRDGYAGAVKGVLKIYSDEIEVIDITHEIESFNIKQAAFTILNYYNQYPKGTVHLAVVDPEVGSERKVLIIQTENYHLVGPDNGIFNYLMQRDTFKIYKVDPDSIYDHQQGATFHARDIFAPVAARLALGERPEHIGIPMDTINAADHRKPITAKDLRQIEVDVIGYDKFGNIIFDYSKFDLHSVMNHRVNTVRFKNFESNQIYDYYSQVAKKSPIFLWNSLGFLELAIFKGSARDYYGLDITDKGTIIF